MHFNLQMRYKKYACILMIAIYAMLYEKANAQSAPCVVETTFLVNIQAKPTAGFNFIANGLIASFSNSSVNAMTYSWDFGDPNSGASNTSSETNPTHDFSAPGTYLVTLTAMNACGSQMITQEVVIVCTPPQVSVTSNDPLQFCEGGSALLQATPSNLTIYQWYFNDLPIPSATSPTLSVTDAGQYKVLVTDIFGCENFSGLLVVEVYPLPLVSISGLNVDYTEDSPPVQLIGTPIGGTFSGAGLVGDQFDPSAAGVGQHTIYYTYTDANNCTNKDSAVVNVSPVSATNLPIVISQIQVSPNPNQGDFWLKILLSANRKLDFCLVNTLGQTLANRQELLPSGQTILHFSSNEWSSGVYFLKILDGEQYACLRVIVNK